jgi:C1A family cysteine protease
MERIFNYVREPKDDRDFQFRPAKARYIEENPLGVDLDADERIPIFDQGSLGSCTANAGCYFIEFLRNKYDSYYFQLSRSYLYYHSRLIQGWENEDSGAFGRDMMKVIQQRGVCTESRFPYDRTTFTNKPTEDAEENAGNHKIISYHRINTLPEIVASLNEGFPVLFGMDVFPSFLSVKVSETGIMPDLNPFDLNYGGHYVAAVGYMRIEDKFYIKVRNSWGKPWGDEGYFYLPESYFNGYNTFDMWTGR